MFALASIPSNLVLSPSVKAPSLGFTWSVEIVTPLIPARSVTSESISAPAAVTFAVSVTSADASIPSNLLWSASVKTFEFDALSTSDLISAASTPNAVRAAEAVVAPVPPSLIASVPVLLDAPKSIASLLLSNTAPPLDFASIDNVLPDFAIPSPAVIWPAPENWVNDRSVEPSVIILFVVNTNPALACVVPSSIKVNAPAVTSLSDVKLSKSVALVQLPPSTHI